MKYLLFPFVLGLFSLSLSAQTATQVSVQDTRHTLTNPSSYSKNLQLHFKYHAAMSGLDGGLFFPVLGIRGWTDDNSGGKAHELTFSDDNQVYVRSGLSPAWEGWRRLLSENTSGNVGIGTKSPDQKLTIKGGGIGFDGNSGDKKLYSPSDGVLEWMTHDLAGERAFAVSHQGTKRVYLSALGNSYLMGGNVGIGTTTPQARLQLKNGFMMASDPSFDNINVKVDGTNIPSLRFTRWTGGGLQQHNAFAGQFYNTALDEYSFAIGTGSSNSGDQNSSSTVLTATLNGNVGIGTTNPQAKLAVNGDIFSKKVKVTQTGWPDYVFASNYKLPTLQEVEAFIKTNKHLPDVLSAKEVEANGLDIGDNQAVLLKKIEEQMLYILELNKQLVAQQKEMDALKEAVKTLSTKSKNQ